MNTPNMRPYDEENPPNIEISDSARLFRNTTADLFKAWPEETQQFLDLDEGVRVEALEFDIVFEGRPVIAGVYTQHDGDGLYAEGVELREEEDEEGFCNYVLARNDTELRQLNAPSAAAIQMAQSEACENTPDGPLTLTPIESFQWAFEVGLNAAPVVGEELDTLLGLLTTAEPLLYDEQDS